MSAQILAERSLAAMTTRLNHNVTEVMNLAYRPAQGATVNGTSGAPVGAGVIPAMGAEEIGIRAVEINAYRRGMQDAADILREQLQQLIAPEPIVPEADKSNGKARVEQVYG